MTATVDSGTLLIHTAGIASAMELAGMSRVFSVVEITGLKGMFPP